MSQEVDLSTPLTDQERAYLDGRGRYAEIERADNLSGVETPEYGAGDGTGLQQVGLMTSEQRASERDRLLARLAEIESDGGDVPGVEEGEDLPYSEWKVPALDAELKLRELPVTGDKAAKVKRLEEDDELAEVNGQS